MAADTQNLAEAGAGVASAYLFTLTRGDGFDLPEYLAPVGDFGSYVRSFIPESWRLRMSGLWYHAIPKNCRLPQSGFKLHVSSTVENARRTIALVAPICSARECQFKVLRGENFLALANSKSFPREAAHKFITLYPRDLAQFKTIAEEIRVASSGLAGPRVLSDRPVGDSQVVFYRYGGFTPEEQLDASGHRKLVLRGPDNQIVPDRRRPFFLLPEGIEDPFGQSRDLRINARPLLNGRYRVTDALAFSTCGGTYLAEDSGTGNQVVIKEARPFTRLSSNLAVTFSRTESLYREAEILELLSGVEGIPCLLETFEEGGHLFVVQSKLEGKLLRSYRASDHLLLTPFELGVDTRPIERFFAACARNLILAVQSVHRRRIILGDISVGNVLVGEDGGIALLDFESAWAMQWGERPDAIASTWMTPGYRRPERGALDPSSYRDDWFGVGMVLFGILLPVERQITFNGAAARKFLDAIRCATGLGDWVGHCISELWKGRPERALRAVDQRASESPVRFSSSGISDNDHEVAPRPWIDALSAIRDSLRTRFDASREDRLWPCDFEAFLTSPLNLASGAGGAVMALCDPADPFPAEIREVLARIEPDPKRCAPGLWNGLAGIAIWKYRHIDREQGLRWIGAALESPLSRTDPGYFHGMSGIGLACLQLFQWSGDSRFLDAAVSIGSALESRARQSRGMPVWTRADGAELPIGLAHGASGIALFLLHLSRMREQERFEPLARAALEQDLRRRSPAYPDDRPRWTYPGKDTLWSPYWMEGGSGIGSVVARFHHHLGDRRYRDLARNIADANYSRFTVLPGQFEGVAGIGECMLDVAVLCNLPEYQNRAEAIARTIILYGVRRDEGLAFPGRHLLKLSCCYGYGSAGIALFFQRLADGAGRLLHDMV